MTARPPDPVRPHPSSGRGLARLAPPEPILEPDLPIIDTHHHLWDRRGHRYLLHDFLADVATGHNLVATVFLECHSMYRAAGPAEMRPVGETEFVAGQAAMSASGVYGPTRWRPASSGFADLTLGDRVEPVASASPRRRRALPRRAPFGGVGRERRHRQQRGGDAPRIYRRADFRAGLARLTALGLSLDAWVFHPQLADVVDLARALPRRRSCSATWAARSATAPMPASATTCSRAGRRR